MTLPGPVEVAVRERVLQAAAEGIARGQMPDFGGFAAQELEAAFAPAFRNAEVPYWRGGHRHSFHHVNPMWIQSLDFKVRWAGDGQSELTVLDALQAHCELGQGPVLCLRVEGSWGSRQLAIIGEPSYVLYAD